MSPEKGPFQKERIVFQPSFFRGYVSFQGKILEVRSLIAYSYLRGHKTNPQKKTPTTTKKNTFPKLFVGQENPTNNQKNQPKIVVDFQCQCPLWEKKSTQKITFPSFVDHLQLRKKKLNQKICPPKFAKSEQQQQQQQKTTFPNDSGQIMIFHKPRFPRKSRGFPETSAT